MSDDTAYVQALIDAAWLVGGVVQLEARDYLVSGLVLPDGATRSLTIRGAGRSYNDAAYPATKGGTRLICLNGTAISYSGSAGLYRPVFTIEDLTILGSGTKTNPPNGSGLRINGGTSVPIVLLKNVFVAWFYGGAGVWLSNCEDGSMINVHTLYCDIGIRGDNAYNHHAHVNVSAELCKTVGIQIDYGRSLTFHGCMIQSNERTGLHLRNVRACHIAGLHAENNNRLDIPDTYAVLIEGPSAAGIALGQSQFVFPRDKIMLRDDVQSARIVGGYCGATSPAITLGMNVRGTLIDEVVPATSVQNIGATGTRVVWGGT